MQSLYVLTPISSDHLHIILLIPKTTQFIWMASFNLSPPIEGVFSTFEHLLSELQDHAKNHGYAVAIGRTNWHRNGTIRTRYIWCVKSEKPHNTVLIDCKKPFLSQKTDCPFQCQTQQIDDDNNNCQWQLMVMNGSHNHEAHNPIAHHQHRKFIADAKEQVAFMTWVGIALKEIASALSIKFPDQLWTMQDIYNL